MIKEELFATHKKFTRGRSCSFLMKKVYKFHNQEVDRGKGGNLSRYRWFFFYFFFSIMNWRQIKKNHHIFLYDTPFLLVKNVTIFAIKRLGGGEDLSGRRYFFTSSLSRNPLARPDDHNYINISPTGFEASPKKICILRWTFR